MVRDSRVTPTGLTLCLQESLQVESGAYSGGDFRGNRAESIGGARQPPGTHGIKALLDLLTECKTPSRKVESGGGLE
jgi:hypothetical protein